MGEKVFLQEKYIRLYKVIGTGAAVYFGFRYILPLFAPFLFAWLLALAVRRPTDFLYRKLKIPPLFGGACSLILLSGFIGALLFYLGRMLIGQITLLLENYTVYEQLFEQCVDSACGYCDNMFHIDTGTTYRMVENGIGSVTRTIQEDVLPTLTKQSLKAAASVAGLLAGIFITFMSAVLLVKDMEEYKEGYRNSPFYKELHRVTERLSEAGAAYLKTQGILIALVAACCTVGLLFVKPEYALLLGILIAVFDAFPVLGSGLILIPWAVWSGFTGNLLHAAVLATIYIACQVIRELLEPKLLGDKIGLKPVYTLMAMYVGVKLFGIAGFLLGPFGLIIIMAVAGIKGEERNRKRKKRLLRR